MANRPGLGVWAWPFRVLREMRGDLMEVAQRLRPPWRRWMTAHAIGHNLLHWGSHLRMQEHTLLGGRVEREADETEPSGRGRSRNRQ